MGLNHKGIRFNSNDSFMNNLREITRPTTEYYDNIMPEYRDRYMWSFYQSKRPISAVRLAL